MAEESLPFPFRAFSAERLRLQQRIAEAAQQPLVRRTARPLPALSVANREQKEGMAAAARVAGRTAGRPRSDALPTGLKGGALLDEAHARGVGPLRAAWFIRIVYRNSVSDGGRNVRIAVQQRRTAWTDEATRYMEALLHELANAHRPPTVTKAHSPAALGGPQALAEKFHYAAAVMALTFEQGLLSRLRWVDWLLEQLVGGVSGLLSLSASLPANAALPAFGAAFSLWYHKSALLLAVLAPYLSAPSSSAASTPSACSRSSALCRPSSAPCTRCTASSSCSARG